MTWKLIIQLGLIALFVGAIPLLITAYKGNLQNLHRFVWLLIFLTFDLILFGAFTRLTDSGLGCPDWPGCYGHSNPLFAMEHIQEAEQQMPFGPVTVTKAWIEMLHRYLFARSLWCFYSDLSSSAPDCFNTPHTCFMFHHGAHSTIWAYSTKASDIKTTEIHQGNTTLGHPYRL